MAAVLAPLAVHIALIKRRLLIIAGTVLVAFALTFAYAADLIAWLKRHFVDDLMFYGPTEALFASIKVAFLAGVVLSLPVLFYQFWKFIEPALLSRERRWSVTIFCLAAGLVVVYDAADGGAADGVVRAGGSGGPVVRAGADGRRAEHEGQS